MTVTPENIEPDALKATPAGQNAPKTDNPLEQFIKPLPDPSGATPTGTGSQDWRSQLLDYGKQFVNTPYKWGGNSPLGFDCSGFVQYVYKHFGVDLPRISYQQANYGPRTTLANAQVGDLIAWDWNSNNPGADHIGIYAGKDAQGRPLVLDAPKAGDVVKIQLANWGNPWVVSMSGVK